MRRIAAVFILSGLLTAGCDDDGTIATTPDIGKKDHAVQKDMGVGDTTTPVDMNMNDGLPAVDAPKGKDSCCGADLPAVDAPKGKDSCCGADLPIKLDGPPKKDTGPASPGTFVKINKGTFKMGSPAAEKCHYTDEEQHDVTLTHDFEIQTTEVTQAQFKALMSYNPSVFKSCGDNCPVEKVKWYEAAAYCNALSAKIGYAQCYTCTNSGTMVTCTWAVGYENEKTYKCPGYRLPTEAEWEYAYRAGTQTAYYNGANAT